MFGRGGNATFGDLSKALEALQVTGAQTLDQTNLSGAPIKRESLETMVRSLTYNREHMRIWEDIPKQRVWNNINERVNMNKFGSLDGGFVGEGEVGEEQTTEFERKAEPVRYIAEIRRVTEQMKVIQTMEGVADAMTIETESGLMNVMGRANLNIVRADNSKVGVEWNGLWAQHQSSATLADYMASTQVIDLRGARLSSTTLSEAARRAVDVFGSIDSLYAPPVVIDGFTQTYRDDSRVIMASVTGETTLGIRASKALTQYGTLTLNHDLFLNPIAERIKVAGAGSTSDSAPPQPIAGGTPTAVIPTDASSKFVTADAGDYLYAVTAYNQFGESALTSLGAAVTVASGNSVDLSFTKGVDIAGRPTSAFRIYRTKKNETVKYHLIAEVREADVVAGYDGGTANEFRDRNRFIAGTYQAFALQNNKQVWGFNQLLPISKKMLAETSLSTPFVVYLFGNPMLYQPRKFIRFINVGE